MRTPMTARRWGAPAAGPTTPQDAGPDSGPRPGRAPGRLLRRHWLMSVLLLAGLVLRVLATIAYQPALLYIDSLKYLFGAWPGNDPLGYNVILKVLLVPGNLTAVAVIQHLVGLAMAVVLYALLLRRGVPRWLAALAAAPVLLDAYELQIEQTIMPDVWFEAFIVAGLAVLLWRPRPGLKATVAGGLLLGLSAPVAQVGQILIVPALLYVLIAVGGWRRKLAYGAALCVAFALPIVVFSMREYEVSKHFSLAPAAGSTIYGRLAYSADCATLNLPSTERVLCPAPALAQRLGPDGLVHSADSPDHTYVAPRGLSHAKGVSDFEHAVLTQQPFRVAGGILRDAAKLFAVSRHTSPGDTAISRWQFQT
ncbi:MAG: phospholipid carrier-dependent glycosyltransferase, partial [Streptosporangiales bacterium]